MFYNKDYTERQSIGQNRNGDGCDGGDCSDAVRSHNTRPNNVYFPGSKNLYNVTQYGIYLVKKINNPKDLK
jgi:hypothetical protein